MRLSARNVFKGKVLKVTEGSVNSEVIVEGPGGAEIVAIITKQSAIDLDLRVGQEVYAFFKASNVMIAKD
jgi:molybdopterin-binding protein